MMHAGPFVVYALAQIRQQELDRKARTAWLYGTPDAPRREAVVRTSSVRLDAVAQGC
jgi:hypothetical protein